MLYGGLSVWRSRRSALPMAMSAETRREIEAALCEHFEAMQELMHRLGHGPVPGLELQLSGRSFDSQVIYRWEATHV